MADRISEEQESLFDYERREDGTMAFYFRPRRLLPDETREHFKAAQKEILLAFRSLVDIAIRREERAEARTERAHKVQVT